MIGIIDYGMGNLLSVFNAVDHLGGEAKIVNSPAMLDSFDKIILPGVGAFGDCIKNLKSTGFFDALQEQVLVKKKPILGICLGMQVMARKGFENGEFDGLGWFDADIIKLHPESPSYRIPHVGWAEIDIKLKDPLLLKQPKNPEFYFVHSYYMKCKDPGDIVATFSHGGEFTAMVRKDNIVGCQFHPEKSQELGLKILENFIDI